MLAGSCYSDFIELCQEFEAATGLDDEDLGMNTDRVQYVAHAAMEGHSDTETDTDAAPSEANERGDTTMNAASEAEAMDVEEEAPADIEEPSQDDDAAEEISPDAPHHP